MESGTNRTKIAIVRRQWLSSQRLNSQLLSNLLRKSLSHGLHKSGNVVALLLGVLALLGVTASAQTSSQLPFDVSNPKHLDWPTDEANRIYASACELVARSIRPEKPPRLTPRFVLVLGSDENATVRSGPTAEIHLKEWNPARFAEAMVLMATREILKNEDVMNLTRDTLMAAQASVSVSELKRRK
jgi:hypothetical protein